MEKYDGTYIGIVEDNNDPKKLGRLKIRVLNLFDDIQTGDIPWASPWKDLNGNGFNLPEVGKIITVIFDRGDVNSPEYIYSEHYNINLENKLKSLSDSDYSSMKSILFDHKTQIYVNDGEGLKIDYKYNNINITKSGVDINLKDNNSTLNLGDSTASQQVILGNHFLNWMGKFLRTIQRGGFTNAGGPVVSTPAMLALMVEFHVLKDFRFLSHHVNVVDNNKVSTVRSEKRESTAQFGDGWTSTKKENTFSKVENEDFKPVEGPRKEYDIELPISATESGTASIDINNLNLPNLNVSDLDLPNLNLSNLDIANLDFANIKSVNDLNVLNLDLPGEGVEDILKSVNEIGDSIGVQQNLLELEPNRVNKNPLLDRIISFVESKGYRVYKEKYILNMVAMRDKDSGEVTNKFDEILYVFYIDENDNWVLNEYTITTVPGLNRSSRIELPSEVSILANGQYIDQCKLDKYLTDKKCLRFSEASVHQNESLDRYQYSTDVITGNFGLSIHQSVDSGSAEYVYEYSYNGDQVFKRTNEFKQFIKLCETQSQVKDTFTYTLCRKSEFDNFQS